MFTGQVDLGNLVTLAGVIAAVATSTWSLAWWFSKEFASIRKFVSENTEKFLTKLEYHEKHDDQRFATINDNIWELRLQNAIKNGSYFAQKNDYQGQSREGGEKAKG